MIELDWGDADETILVWTFCEGWTADHYYQAIHDAEKMALASNQPIHVLVDAQHIFKSPRNLITLANAGLNRGTVPVKLIFVITQSGFLENIYHIMTRIYPDSLKVHFVPNANEAYRLIREYEKLQGQST